MRSLKLFPMILIVLTCLSYWGGKLDTKVQTSLPQKQEVVPKCFKVEQTLKISLQKGGSINRTAEIEISIGDSEGLLSIDHLQDQLHSKFPDIPIGSYFYVYRGEDEDPYEIEITENAAYTINGGGMTSAFAELILIFVGIASHNV